MVRRLRQLRAGFPLTGGGALLLVLSLVGLLRYGYGQADLVLLVLGAVGATVAVISAGSVALGALALRLALRDHQPDTPLELECGYPGRTGLSLGIAAFLPFADVSWTWVSPAAEAEVRRRWGTLSERVVPTRRGYADAVVRCFDAFGLAAISFEHTVERRYRAVPTKGALQTMHVVQGMGAGDAIAHPDGPPGGDPMDMRHYNPGDPIRLVLWKVFAKSRTLVVRTPEHALAPVRQTVAYMVAGPGDGPAAGAARAAVEGGALGQDWTLGADGSLGRARDAALDLLVRSASQPDSAGAEGLAGFLAEGASQGARRAVVFVPPREGEWVERAIACAGARPAGCSVEFVVAVDGLREGRKGAMRWLLAPAKTGAEHAPPADAAEVGRLVRRLAASGARVMLVDRAAGRVFDQSQLHLLHRAA